MLPQNNGSESINLPNFSDRLCSLEGSYPPKPILDFIDQFTKSQMEFVLAMTRLYQPSQDSADDIYSWLMVKAKEYDNRLKPLNPRLEFRSNDGLLDFIVKCAMAEANRRHSC